MAELNHQVRADEHFRTPMTFVAQTEEQRAYPRFQLDVSVSFRNAAGNRCRGQVINISPDGLQVRCNFSAGQSLHPKGGKLCADTAPIVQVALHLPVAGESKKVVAGAKLVYATTLDNDPNCVLGFKFLELRPMAQRVLDGYFSERMAAFYEDDPQAAAN